MTNDIKLKFCTYFKHLERFRYDCETYEEYVAFCVKSGSFTYRIGEEKEKTLSEGEMVICPPNNSFYRKTVVPVEFCMIKFQVNEPFYGCGKKILIAPVLRWNEDLEKLENCLFCYTVAQDPLFSHYCMDILYIAQESICQRDALSDIKRYLEQNYDKDVSVYALASNVGYTAPYFIRKFRSLYGVTPKAYHAQLRVAKAKELLQTTDRLSREIADDLGFSDEFYFIRFFKKQTGMTPKEFRSSRW